MSLDQIKAAQAFMDKRAVTPTNRGVDLAVADSERVQGHTPGQLFLEDLTALTDAELREHIADNYAGSVSGFDYGYPGDDEKAALLEKLNHFDILIAYESVGSWGCDSSSWFLLREKSTGRLLESHGSHCSCYGFEGQWDPEETTLEHLCSDKFYLPTGGYDNDESGNKAKVLAFFEALKATGAAK